MRHSVIRFLRSELYFVTWLSFIIKIFWDSSHGTGDFLSVFNRVRVTDFLEPEVLSCINLMLTWDSLILVKNGIRRGNRTVSHTVPLEMSHDSKSPVKHSAGTISNIFVRVVSGVSESSVLSCSVFTLELLINYYCKKEGTYYTVSSGVEGLPWIRFCTQQV